METRASTPFSAMLARDESGRLARGRTPPAKGQLTQKQLQKNCNTDMDISVFLSILNCVLVAVLAGSRRSYTLVPSHMAKAKCLMS